MPVYSLFCPGCRKNDSMFRSIAERNDVPRCSCGEKFERIIDRPMVRAEITPYYSPNGTGLISTRSERERDLKRSNAIPWEPGIEKDIARKKQYIQEEAFKPIANAVDNIVRELNVNGKLESANV